MQQRSFKPKLLLQTAIDQILILKPAFPPFSICFGETEDREWLVIAMGSDGWWVDSDDFNGEWVGKEMTYARAAAVPAH